MSKFGFGSILRLVAILIRQLHCKGLGRKWIGRPQFFRAKTPDVFRRRK